MQDKVRQFLMAADSFIESRAGEWNIDHNVEIEILNHFLRVRIQDGTIARYHSLLLGLCAKQHDDGGWGDTRDERDSRTRATAFCTQMLLRANRILKNSALEASFRKGLDFIVKHQQRDGSWRDHRWHFWDATSVSVGTLIFAIREPHPKEEYGLTLSRGMTFIINGQETDGGWYYKPTASAVVTTAHLLQKCLVYDASENLILRGIQLLLGLQSQEGHWDKKNVDHTCDAARCLMLASRFAPAKPLIPQIGQSTEWAIDWLVNTAVDGGLGPRPSTTANVLLTCDGIDTALKYLCFKDKSDIALLPTFYQ